MSVFNVVCLGVLLAWNGAVGLRLQTSENISHIRVKMDSFIYLTQGPAEPPQWLCRVGARHDSQVIYASFQKFLPAVCSGITRYLHVNKTTWTTGRNALYNAALDLQHQQMWRAMYLIFTDHDSELRSSTKTGDPYSLLHLILGNIQPAVAGVGFGPGRNNCGPVSPCAPDIDANFNAFHATAAPMFLPYDPSFDNSSWHVSQAIIIELLLATAPEFAVQLNQLTASNSRVHAPYPRETTDYSGTDHGFSNVQTYLRSRVNPCLRNRIGLHKAYGSGVACHKCALSSSCDVEQSCANRGPQTLKNYLNMIQCKPYPMHEPPTQPNLR